MLFSIDGVELYLVIFWGCRVQDDLALMLEGEPRVLIFIAHTIYTKSIFYI